MSEQREFKRDLNLFDSTMIIIGSMIGSGIFIVSADIARTVGSPGLLILVWVITGLVTLIGALSYGELAGMMPHAGGIYVYLREAYSPLIAFLFGWTLFLVIQTGTIAAVAVAFAKFSGVLFPAVGETNILLTLFGLKISAAQILAIASIAVLTWVNLRGVRTGKRVQNSFTVVKIATLIGFIGLGIILGANTPAIKANFAAFWKGSWTHLAGGAVSGVTPLSGLMLLAAIGAAMVGSLFSSDAWYGITYAAGEIKNPRKTIPMSLLIGTATVCVLYVLANLAYILILPVVGSPEAAGVAGRGIQFAMSDRVGTAAAQVMFGGPAASIMAVLIMISTFGCNNGLILAGARVYYVMSRDGLFFKKAGALSKKSVPGVALVVQGVWASALCLSGTYNQLLDYVVFAVLIFFALTVSGIFILRRKKPDAERPYKAFGYPVVPALYVLVALAIAVDLLIFKPGYTLPGLGIVLLGVPVFFIWRALAKPVKENAEG
ncbi:MAG: amino acid permease [Acidobacteriota bacterium]|nr:amino acid permease [Acidobacteriota bacterium]